ncbi:MAG: MurR/RpiR family transcriptional regulator [Lysinibacillus sp.]
MTICESIKKRYIRLSKGQRKVAQYVIDNPNAVATQVASEIGRLAGVSESTVIRFCYAMSLAGYSELQEKMKQYILEKDGVIPVLPKTHASKRQNIQFNDVLTKDMKELLTVLQQTDLQQCNATIQTIHDAKEIYIVGFEEALPIAFSLYYQLSQLRENVHIVQNESINRGIDFLQTISSSAVIVISLDDQQEGVAALTEVLKRKNTSVITISNKTYVKLKKVSSNYFDLNKQGQLEDGTVAMYAFVHALIKCLVAEFEDSYQQQANKQQKQTIHKTLIEVS